MVEPNEASCYQCGVGLLSHEDVNDLRTAWIQGDRSKTVQQVRIRVANTSKMDILQAEITDEISCFSELSDIWERQQ